MKLTDKRIKKMLEDEHYDLYFKVALRELQQTREERQKLLTLVEPLKDAIADQGCTELMQGQVEWFASAVQAIKRIEPDYVSNYDEYADLPEVE